MVLAHLNALKNKNRHEQFTSNFTIFYSNTSRWLLLEGRNGKKNGAKQLLFSLEVNKSYLRPLRGPENLNLNTGYMLKIFSYECISKF